MTKLLIIHHGALGDVVATFPAIIRLKQFFSQIDLLCQQKIGKLANECYVVDRWLSLETASFASLYSDPVNPKVTNILRAYHEIILFSRSRPLQDTITKITGKKVHGIRPRPDVDQKIHVTEHILSNLIRCRLLEKIDSKSNSILLSRGHSDRRDPQYNRTGILIHPGSGGRKKCWPVSNFIKIASSLELSGKKPEFILGPAEHSLAEELLRQGIDNDKIHIIDYLTELASLLKMAGGFIGNDSGVSHLAAFLGLPTVAVFGPSDPEIWRPIGRAVEIVKPDLDCSPCFETNKIDCEEMECFTITSPEMVLDAFYKLIDNDNPVTP